MSLKSPQKKKNGKTFDKGHSLKFTVNMSYSKNANKTFDKTKLDSQTIDKNGEEGEMISYEVDSRTYAITVSKKPSADIDGPLCGGQRSFISIHSTDQLQVADAENISNLEECNVEVLSLNEVFPSTSDESLSNDEDSSMDKKHRHVKKHMPKSSSVRATPTYVPTNSKSSTMSGRKEILDSQAPVHSDFNIPKSTMYVVGSNPGEPKMSYVDQPKKISKNMKKYLRGIDKHKNDSRQNEPAIKKLMMRSILKDGRCDPECTGDSTSNGNDVDEDLTLPFTIDFSHGKYSKQSSDRNVTFNTQVVIIHFKGDLCIGQSVEALSKEKDQQARNSELRKTFLSKYNELWPTQK